MTGGVPQDGAGHASFRWPWRHGRVLYIAAFPPLFAFSLPSTHQPALRPCHTVRPACPSVTPLTSASARAHLRASTSVLALLSRVHLRAGTSAPVLSCPPPCLHFRPYSFVPVPASTLLSLSLAPAHAAVLCRPLLRPAERRFTPPRPAPPCSAPPAPPHRRSADSPAAPSGALPFQITTST